MTIDFLQQIATRLHAAHLDATVEYPGWLNVSVASGSADYLAFGEADNDDYVLAVTYWLADGTTRPLPAGLPDQYTGTVGSLAVAIAHVVAHVRLVDLVERAGSVITESEGADEHGGLLRDIDAVLKLVNRDMREVTQ